MIKLRRLPSFWLLCAFLIVWLLQAFPYTGIVMMFLVAPLWCGLLLLAFMVVLFVEALIGRVPRWLMVAPVLFFGGYYGLYFQQGVQISIRETELQNSNTTKIYDFDAARENLITAHGQGLVTQYRIPVVYSKNENYNEGHLSYRMLMKKTCDSIPKDSESQISTSRVHYRDKPRAGQSLGRTHSRKGLCVLRMPEKPSKNIVTIEVKGQQIWKKKSTIEEGVYTLSKNNVVLGEYRTASVQKYQIFPFPIVGCFLNSGAPSWDCSIGFDKSLYRLKTNPASMTQDVKINPVALMLGLKKYTDEDYAIFKNPPDSAVAIKKAQGTAKNLTRGMFEQLDKMMVDPKQKIAWRMGYTLSGDLESIRIRAAKIVDYLKTLEDSKRGEIYDMDGKQDLMFSLIANLPDNALNVFAPKVFERLKKYRKPGGAPEFYIRFADTARIAHGLGLFYEKQLTTGKIRGWQNYLPASALCRIGKASSKTIDFMKAKFKSEGRKEQTSKYHEALFLALLATGERDFVESTLSKQNMRHANWYNTILDGKADGPAGPNNCMVRDGKIGSWLPASMQPIAKKF